MFIERIVPLVASCAIAGVLLASCAVPNSSPVTDDNFVSGQQSRCLTDGEIVQWIRAYAVRLPLRNPPAIMNVKDAVCTREKFQRQLAHMAGPEVGYKVDLSNVSVQKTFHVTEPIWGAYYQSMFLPTNSVVDVRYGAQPIYRADLLVRVKDDAINEAQTPEDALKHIDQIIPFIELADMLVQKPSELTANNMMAINAGARLGVMGKPFLVSSDAKVQRRLLRELGSMSVRVIGNRGRLLARGKGSDVMGHPLKSIIWLTADLRKQGLALRPGQWVSLGAFSPMLRPKAEDKVTVAYPGLTGVRSVIVRFR